MQRKDGTYDLPDEWIVNHAILAEFDSLIAETLLSR